RLGPLPPVVEPSSVLDRSGDLCALLHPAGQLVGLGVTEVAESHQFEVTPRLLRTFLLAHLAHAHPQRHVVASEVRLNPLRGKVLLGALCRAGGPVPPRYASGRREESGGEASGRRPSPAARRT